MGDDLRSKLPDELVDELLADASSEEEIVLPGGLLSIRPRPSRPAPDRKSWVGRFEAVARTSNAPVQPRRKRWLASIRVSD